MQENIGHTEPFTTEEFDYLTSTARKESRNYRKLALILVASDLIFFLLLFLFALYTFDPHQHYQEYETPLSPSNVIIIAASTNALIGFVLLLIYLINIRILFKELKNGFKVIEQARIYKKKYMPHNQSFHFYINSRVLKTIEIDQTTFDKYQINDEINVEYTPKSLKSLGYY